MSVTKISEYTSRDVGVILKGLTAQHERGELTGIAVACKVGPDHHGIALAGDYWTDPVPALAVCSRVEHRINLRIDGTKTGPR